MTSVGTAQLPAPVTEVCFVYIVAASFSDQDTAAGAVRELEHRYGTASAPRLAPLATPEASQQCVIVAGRFDGGRLDEVLDLMAAYGGSLVASLDERRTLPSGGWQRRGQGRASALL